MDEWSRHRAQYNYDPFTLHPEEKHYSYPLITADELAARSNWLSSSTTDSTCKAGEEKSKNISTGPGGRPRQVRMLARDFIHDSLYNPTYGYFTKQAVLLPDPNPEAGEQDEADECKQVGGQLYKQEMGLLRPANPAFDFNRIRNESEFMRLVEERYQMFEEQISILVQDHQNSRIAARASEHFADSGGASLLDERKERLRKRRQREREDNPTKRASTKGAAAEYSAEGLEAAQERGRAMARREGVQEADVQAMAAKQVWHTPTQIFQPYYAHALARYLVAEYKLHNYPYDDLVIYELGAGSGTLARGILDYLADYEPEIYTRTRYKIVEISTRLAEEQRRKLAKHSQVHGKVEVVNKDVLAWDGAVVQEACFVIALEVWDNLAHDVVRFAMDDGTPYQAVVSIDDTGDMHELWEPLSDPLIQRYLDLIGVSSLSPLSTSALRFLPDWLRSGLAKHAPLFPNLSQPTFVPTHALRLVQKLHTHFPRHRLIMSDFHSLPDSLAGTNAPVVQTRYNRTMIPVTTYLVLQGYFDIFFPTNFLHLKQLYKAIHSPPSTPLNTGFFISSTASSIRATENVKIYPHAHFFARYAHLDHLRLQDGSNPLLSWYANASWFLS